MAKSKIQLPSILTKDSWFYEANKELCDPHLNKPYISYSSSESWESYTNDFIKQKFVGIKLPSGVYSALGNYLGEAVENGFFGENEHGFTGQENFSLIPRPENAEYEKMVLIDFGDFIFIGFIDIYVENEDGSVKIKDLKTGGANKEKNYMSEDYTQVVLYSAALEKQGKKIDDTSVWFVRRTGSHIKPPLHISDEQFRIPVNYTPELVDKAFKKLKKNVEEISDCYKTYLKIFG